MSGLQVILVHGYNGNSPIERQSPLTTSQYLRRAAFTLRQQPEPSLFELAVAAWLLEEATLDPRLQSPYGYAVAEVVLEALQEGPDGAQERLVGPFRGDPLQDFLGLVRQAYSNHDTQHGVVR